MAQVEIRTQKTQWAESMALGRLKFLLRPKSLPIDGYENQTGSPGRGNLWGVLGVESH